jgi:hypothetical protein
MSRVEKLITLKSEEFLFLWIVWYRYLVFTVHMEELLNSRNTEH